MQLDIESGLICRYCLLPARIKIAARKGWVGTKEPIKMPDGDSTEEHFPECDFDPEKLRLRVRVTRAAERKSVDPVVEQVMDAVREMKCVNGKEDAIELALGEALANAVVHGAKEDPTKTVECLVACDDERGV